MKKMIFKTIILVLIFVFPLSAMANGRMEAGVSISMPPPIVFAGPPHVVVIPQTYVYVAPDVDVDIFFFGGWWWRPWQGRWYRSHDYRSGWSHYRDVPSFYRDVPPGWRNDYHQSRWKGRQWEHQKIPHERVEKDWDRWEKDKHWEKQNNWGVHDVKPETGSSQSYDRGRQQDDRDRKQSRDAVEPERSQPQHSQPQQRDHDRGKKQKDNRN